MTKTPSEIQSEKQIKNHFNLQEEIIFLGKGSEGYVWTNGQNVYKVIDNSSAKLELYWTLLSLEEKRKSLDNIQVLANFSVSFADNLVFIKYPYETTTEFGNGNNLAIDEFINSLQQLRQIGWVLWDLQPKNLRITKEKKILIIDIGRSFIPTSNYLFDSMCRRAFVIYKLQNKKLSNKEFVKYLRSVNKSADFVLMQELDFLEIDLKKEFDNFYQKIIR